MIMSVDDLARGIREIHARDPDRAEESVEAFLSQELGTLNLEERLDVLRRLENHFTQGCRGGGQGIDRVILERLVPMFLGRDTDAGALDGPELADRLAAALNTVFSTLNELVAVINSSLGGSPSGDETIRRIIGGTLGGDPQGMSIEDYLGRIRDAFLAAQQSARDAARTMAGYILKELDPSTMAPQPGGFMIGPLRKAEAFELFEEKYKRVRKWYDSERFLLDFLRQFERNCQKSFT